MRYNRPVEDADPFVGGPRDVSRHCNAAVTDSHGAGKAAALAVASAPIPRAMLLKVLVQPWPMMLSPLTDRQVALASWA